MGGDFDGGYFVLSQDKLPTIRGIASGVTF